MTKKLKTFHLAAVIFLTVSGGPYGLEPLISYAGGGAALLLLVITPLLWDVPIILTVLELNSFMPVTGGYYQWVKRALGLRFAFYEGWWTWLYTFADLAIYPVLFVTYAAFFFPDIAAYKLPVCLLIIWLSACINILGIVPVGRVSICLSIAVLIPFIVLVIMAVYKYGYSFHLPPVLLKEKKFSSIGMALYTVMWNFIGWDNTTTYAEEVSRPVRSYLKAIFIAFFLVFGIYFIITLITINSGIDAIELKDKLFPFLGSFVGGRWLGSLVAMGGMASTLGLYSAVLLSVSRVPKVMADDRLLPHWLTRLHRRFGSPYISIIACSVIVSGMVLWTFGDLMVIDVTLYGAALSLEFIALLILRRTASAEHRPFKIPLAGWRLFLLVLLPFSVYGIAIASAIIDQGEGWKPLLFAIACVASAEACWQIIQWRKKTIHR